MRKEGVLFGIVQWLHALLRGVLQRIAESMQTLPHRLATIEFREAVESREIIPSK